MRTQRGLACGMMAPVAAALGLAVGPARAGITVDAPAGFEQLKVGSVFTITWHIYIAHELVGWDLWHPTTTNLGPWIPIVEGLPPVDPPIDSVHTYEWTVPVAVAHFAWVRVGMNNVDGEYDNRNDLLFSIVPASPWDVDDSGDVGVTDFLDLPVTWGQAGVPADFDGDGVGVTDFLEMPAHRGPYP